MQNVLSQVLPITGAGDSVELFFCSRGNSCSYFPGAVLIRASFIIMFESFFKSSFKEMIKVLETFWRDWPSCFTVVMDLPQLVFA